MMSLRPGCVVRTICGQLRTSCLHLGSFGFLTPHLPPAEIDAHLQKNHLKRLKIKQGTTSKVNCILFNRLLSPVLLNKSSLARARAGNFNLIFLNKCFSNYYQVQTRPVFAETVTYQDHPWQRPDETIVKGDWKSKMLRERLLKRISNSKIPIVG